MTIVAFHSPGTITLIERLLQAGHHTYGKVVQLAVWSDQLSMYAGSHFGKLFDDLASQNIICIGLYRLMNIVTTPSSSSHYRYVITAPNSKLQIHHTDLILALQSP